MRVSALVAELRKEIANHSYRYDPKSGTTVCGHCQVEVGPESAFFGQHIRNEAVTRCIRQLAQNPKSVETKNLLNAIHSEWDKHSFGAPITRSGKMTFGCAGCQKELRTHSELQQHVSDAIEKAIRMYAKQRKSAA